ncbi:ABC1 kinase family protein [Nocardia takedensis]|uniref:ABC1 kinase family protein n=1 Tax=Nocardia takedensis TaxID=259390 RepID=UPI0002D766B2|nr:AarF/ABC1/UbiB kinase family protein [Nocardia takedensis]
MTIQRGFDRRDADQRGIDRRDAESTDLGTRVPELGAGGTPPVRTAVRNAKLAALPVAFAGRRALGFGRRALGHSPAEIDRDIRTRTARHIFEVLGELKGCATKLGQLLAIYELALPPELSEPYKIALSELQDSAPAMLPATVRATMAAHLGPHWRTRFREFDDRRAAAASLGQVHRAVWHDGREVAVKIMYPGARESVQGDLAQLRRLSTFAGVFVPGADVKAVTEAICACLLEELDYAVEARYQRAFAAAFADDPDFRVPDVVEQYGDVLITEWLDGVPLSRLVTTGTQRERDRAGMRMVRFVLDGCARTTLLYGDPHPGNFRVLPDGRLGVVDFGACCVWPPEGFEDLAVDYCRAIFEGGPSELAEATRRHGFVQAGRVFDVDALFKAMLPCGEPLRHPTFRMSSPWLRRQVVRATRPKLSNVARECTIPAYFVPFARSSLTLIGALAQLETEGAYRDEVVRSIPALAEVFDRVDQRASGPVDLAAARERRASSGAVTAGPDRTRR